MYAEDIGKEAQLIDCAASVMPGGHVTKTNMVPIDLQVRSWEEPMKILNAWSTNPKVNQGMKVIIIAQYSRYLDCLPDKRDSLGLAPKQRLSSTSRGITAATTYTEERERQDFRADEIFTRWICKRSSVEK